MSDFTRYDQFNKTKVLIMKTFDTVIISEIENESDDLTTHTNNEFLSFHVPNKASSF